MEGRRRREVVLWCGSSQPATDWASQPHTPFSEKRWWLAHVGHGAPMEPVLITSCVAAFLLYFNTLDAEFAYDDSRAIKTNPDVLPTTPLSQLLWDDFWGTPLTHSGSHKSYRPLTVLSFRINYMLSEFQPRSYHVTNVLLHVAATGLFAVLARTLTPHARLARTAAPLLFAAHPIHTEAVAGVVGRADVGAAIFFLGALLSYMRYCGCVRAHGNEVAGGRAVGRRAWLGAALVSATLSMLTKEHGITALAVCGVYHVFVHAKLRPRELFTVLTERRHRGVMEGLLALGAALIVLLSCRLAVMGSQPPEFAPADNPAADCESPGVRALTFFFLPAFNTWLLLCPYTLSFDWSMEAIPLVASLADPRNLASLALYASLGLLALVSLLALRRRRLGEDAGGSETATSGDVTIMGLALILLPFLPATNLFFYVGFVVAERILYIPSMGVCLLVAWGAHLLHARARTARARRLLKVALVVLFLLFSARTWTRNHDWATEENLYRSGIAINPPKAYGNLANILSSQGKKEEAEWAYKKALSYRSNMADVHYNLGILFQEQKRYEEALQEYKLAIQFRPRMAMAHLNMGLVLGLMGQRAEAAEVYRHCSQLDGSGLKDPRTHESTKISALFNLGRLYADDGHFERAISVYQEAVERMPSHYQPQSLYNMLGEAFFKLENLEEAERWYLQALRVKSDHVPAHLTYGKLLAKMQRLGEAEEWFQRAKSLAPNDSTVHQHFGQFLSEVERHEDAADHYVKAAQLAPSEYEIIFNAANTLRQAGRNKQAEEYYRLAVNLRPQATSHMNLGAMLHVNGKLLEAESSYLEALRLKPDDSITRTNLQKLRHLLAKKGISPSR
ncbi:protein O-mannosyl-transferase TMTC2-like isoform X2 [Cherax quadricarinatus]|uniref:protein O-mannosyl-transferase TMTC2-like isoform X2 n=1 Tax=Cherax quadricarinatus TaxID=27406 RepID=UPI00387E7F2B